MLGIDINVGGDTSEDGNCADVNTILDYYIHAIQSYLTSTM